MGERGRGWKIGASLSLTTRTVLAPMAPKSDQSQAPASLADPASAQRLFASMASTTGSGKPCSKGKEREKIGGEKRWLVSISSDDGPRRSGERKTLNPFFLLLFDKTTQTKTEVSPQVIPFSGAGTLTLGGGSACPVGGGSGSSGGGGGCPVMASPSVAADARNLMPMPATPDFNALSPGQSRPLPTARQASSIPMAPEIDVPEHQKKTKEAAAAAAAAAGKASGEAASTSTSTPKEEQGEKEAKTWVYPSQQMFFNAMRRKGWSPAERDMASVVAIHNAVNERAWQEVVAWESAAGFGPRSSPCGGPRLARFVGRPRDLSPKARFLNLLGYRLPFDRHDWFVDRCGKERVRYVIDFYNAAAPVPSTPSSSPSPTSSSPPSSSSSSSSQPVLPAPVSMHLDVRPALDSPGAAWERLKAAVGRVAARRN